jgi:hypothetical protein
MFGAPNICRAASPAAVWVQDSKKQATAVQKV